MTTQKRRKFKSLTVQVTDLDKLEAYRKKNGFRSLTSALHELLIWFEAHD